MSCGRVMLSGCVFRKAETPQGKQHATVYD
jgi:hypothetical protein